MEQAVIEFPMTVGTEANEVINAADDVDGCIWRKCVDAFDVADFDMLVVAAVLTHAGATRIDEFLTGKCSQSSADLVFS